MPVSAAAVEVQPKSVEEMREVLTSPRDPHPPIKITRVSAPEGLLVFRFVTIPGIRMELRPESLFWQKGNRRVNVLLDYFDASTKLQGNEFLVSFQLRHNALARHLKEGLSSVEKTKHPSFVTRALKALVELERELPSERIEEATTAPSDFLVLLNALSASAVATQLTEKDPLAAAKLRGVEKQQELIKAGGGILSAEETAEILGISRQAVDKRRRQGQLIGLAQGRRGYAYPGFQFENGKAIPQLERILEKLSGHDPWTQFSFFLNPNIRLNGHSAVQALRAGDVDNVLKAAMAYGEQGAA